MKIDEILNKLLVDIFQNIMDVEAKALIKGEFSNISVNDMHVIEAIGISEPQSSSVVSKKLGVTMGTLTKAVDGLVAKGYAARTRSETDKRVVFLSLEEKGVRAFKHHAEFHQEMVKEVVTELNEEEKEVLKSCLSRMNNYFLRM